jgi:hypothetical protein
MSDSFNKGRSGKPFGKSTARNEHTGALIKTPASSDAYRNSPFWDSVETKKKLDAVCKVPSLYEVIQETTPDV